MALVNRLLGDSVKGAKDFEHHASSARKHWDNIATNMAVLTSRLGPVLGPLTQGLANEIMKANTWLKSGVAATTQNFVDYADATREVGQVLREAGLSSQQLQGSTAAMVKDLQAVSSTMAGLEVPDQIASAFKDIQSSIAKQQNVMTHIFSDASNETLKFVTRLASLRDQIQAFQEATTETGPVVDARFDKLRATFADLASTQQGYHAAVQKSLGIFGVAAPKLDQFNASIVKSVQALQSLGSGTSVHELQKGLSDLSLLQAEYEHAVGSTGVVLGTMVTKGDLVTTWMKDSVSSASLLQQQIEDLRTNLSSLAKDASVDAAGLDKMTVAVDRLSQAQARLGTGVSTMRDRFAKNSDVFDLLFDQLKKSQQAILGRTAANIVNLSTATLSRIASPLRSSIIAALVAYVDNTFDSLNRHLDIFASNLTQRFKLIRETLYVAAATGASATEAVMLVREFGRLGRIGQANWQEALKTSIMLKEALGLSAEHTASIVVFAERLGTPLGRMADAMAQIRETTKLTAGEMGQYTSSLLQAVMLLDRMKDVSSTVKETLRIDDAIRAFTGESGQFVQAINRMLRTSEGALMAQTLGFGPDQLNRSGGQQAFAERIGGLVDRLTRGQPFLAQITVLEDLSSMTGLSVTALKQMSTVMRDLRSQTDSTKTISQRWKEEVVNLGNSVAKFGNTLRDIFLIGLQPIIYVVNRALYGINNLLSALREWRPVITTLATAITVSAIASGVSMVLAIKRFTAELFKSMVVFNLYAESLRRDTLVRGGLTAAENVGAGKTGLRGMLGRFITKIRLGNLFGRIIPKSFSLLPTSIAALTTTLSSSLLVLTGLVSGILGVIIHTARRQEQITQEIRSIERQGTKSVIETLRRALIDQAARARDVKIGADGSLSVYATRPGKNGQWSDPRKMYQGPLSGLLKDGSITEATYARLIGEFNARVVRMAEDVVNRKATDEILNAGPSSPEVIKRLDSLIAAINKMVLKSDEAQQQSREQFRIEQEAERARRDLEEAQFMIGPAIMPP